MRHQMKIYISLIKKTTLLLLCFFSLTNCDSGNVECLNDFIITLNEPIGPFLNTYKLEKRSDEKKYDYIILTWMKEPSVVDGYVGQEILGIEVDDKGIVEKLSFVLFCDNGFLNCTDLRYKAEEHIAKSFQCIPNLSNVIKTINYEKTLVYENKEYSVFSLDEESERQIIIERKKE